MRYADQVSEIMNAFSPVPLEAEQMEQFYCADTMEYRMNDKYCSPIEDIYDVCTEQNGTCAMLLLGHKGCGKSTELNRMSARLRDAGYQVRTIVCSTDLDLFNLVYSDLFILMGEELLRMADECGCQIDQELLRRIQLFWQQTSEITVCQETAATSMEAGASVNTPGLMEKVLKFFMKVKADLKYNEETRKEYRKIISARSSDWISLLGQIADRIAQKSDGHKPIIIFEDLDKLNPEDAWKVFYHYAAVLSGMPFPLIYTFPIGLSYDPRFSALEAYFITKTLPMIKIETITGEKYEDGIGVIRKVVEKRANCALFEQGVLERLISYTGGSFRDLFHAINASAKRAVRRRSDSISMEDASRALEELKTSLTRRIEQRDYEFLLNIYRGNKELIQDKEMLLKMLQASVVLEYNGKRWHNVHPLVAQFLKDQGLIGDERK